MKIEIDPSVTLTRHAMILMRSERRVNRRNLLRPFFFRDIEIHRSHRASGYHRRSSSFEEREKLVVIFRLSFQMSDFVPRACGALLRDYRYPEMTNRNRLIRRLSSA